MYRETHHLPLFYILHILCLYYFPSKHTPHEGEAAKSMNSKMMLKYMQKDYPSVEINHSNRIKVGLAMKSLGYEWTDHSNVPFYKVVPITAA